MKNLFILFVSLVLNFPLKSQEICNNAIDDDNDGFIDLNDSDCNCYIKSLIPNPSFEDTLCCPNSPSQMGCLIDWIQVSDASTDYYNTCGFIYHEELPIPPIPYPNGNGFVGIYGIDGLSVYKEYLGACLNGFMHQDSIYQISFYVGFGEESISGTGSPSNVELALFGTSDCSNIPYNGFDCPIQASPGDWIELTSVNVSGFDEWKKVNIKFSPSFDVFAVVLGVSCQFFPEESSSYYFFDEIVLNKENDFVQLVSGLQCLGNAILGIEANISDSYQWYKDGIAVLEATANTLAIEPGFEGEGLYQVLINSGDSCFVTQTYEVIFDGFPIASIGVDTVICDNSSIILGENNFGNEYIWSTGDMSKTIEILNPGEYSITVSNDCGVDYDEIVVLDQEIQSNCDLEAPNVFTPDGDGINDTFCIFTDCCIESYNLKIFSRFGNLVFESNNLNDKWNGEYKNSPLPSDTYIWVLNYSINTDNQTIYKKKAGDLSLIK